MLTMLTLQVALGDPLDPAAFTSLDAVFDPGGPVVIDGDGPTISIGGAVTYTGEVHDGIAVFTFGEVLFDTDTFVVGSVPVAVLSQGDLVVAAPISAFGRDALPGPGGHPGGTAVDGEAGAGPGGGRATPRPGAGGGGFGGDGGNAQDGGNGGASYGNLAVLLEGGSGGAKSTETDGGFGPDFENGDGGGGGGAIELGAGNRLDVTVDGSISVDGGEGDTDDQHGGGGGSGGAIVLHATFGGLCDGGLSARGGAGGDDGGFGFSEGGGGGGGRITVLTLESNCETVVTGGSSPNGTAGDDGVTTFVEFVDHDDDADDWTIGEGDCNDADPTVHPEAYDLPGDGIDADCDGEDPIPGETPTTTDTGTPPGTTTTPTTTDPDTFPTDDGAPAELEDEEIVATGECSCASTAGGGLPGLGVLFAVGLVRRRRR